MARSNLCKICGVRRAKRDCPGIDAGICPICCGREREVSIDCPLNCVYLREARVHEGLALSRRKEAAADVPHPDVKVTQNFVKEHGEFLSFCGISLYQGAIETRGAVDRDLTEALEALVRTQRTRESGLIYETRPQNPFAAGIQRHFDASLAKLEEARRTRPEIPIIRNSDLLNSFVFLLRLAKDYDNGRPKGRAFIDLLSRQIPEATSPAQSRLVL
jgi:hypothetical protein